MINLLSMKNGFVIIVMMLSFNVMGQTGYKTIAVDSSYKISVPDYMREVTDLVEGPALQMKSLTPVPILLTVRAEKKSLISALDSGFTNEQYYQYVANIVAGKLELPKISPTQQDTTNHVHYVHGEVRGKFQGTALIYFIRTIETVEYEYQIIIWIEEKTETNTLIGRDVYDILDSFEPLK